MSIDLFFLSFVLVLVLLVSSPVKSSLQYYDWVLPLLQPHLLFCFFSPRKSSTLLPTTDWHAPFSLPSLDRVSLRFGNLDWVSSKLFAPSKTWAPAIHVQPLQQVQIWRMWNYSEAILTIVNIANILDIDNSGYCKYLPRLIRILAAGCLPISIWGATEIAKEMCR